MILNEYSKTAWVNGASPDLNKANLDNLEQGVYDVTAKAMELAAYEVNAATSAAAAAVSQAAAAASAAVYDDLVEDVSNLTTTVANHAKYSTTEEVVIGTYDGKPLYRKCLSIASLPNTAMTNYAHGIANVGNIFIGNNSYATDGIRHLPLPFPNKVSTAVIGVYSTTTDIVIDTGANRSTYSAKVFIEYTKTTD